MKSVRVPMFNAGGEVVGEAIVDATFAPAIVKVTLSPRAEYPDVRYELHGKQYVQPLHHRAYDLSPAALTRPQRLGYEVHHKNGNKFDARSRNLELLLEEDHKRLTALERQRVTYRPGDDLQGGWWRPHAPAPVHHTIVGSTLKADELVRRRAARIRALPDWTTGLTPEQVKAEKQLAGQLTAHRRKVVLKPDLARRIEPMRKLSRAEDPRTFHMRRLGPWPGELAAAMCYVEHAGGYHEMAACLGVRVDLLENICARAPVRNAIEMWRRHRRWPKPTPPAKKRWGRRARRPWRRREGAA